MRESPTELLREAITLAREGKSAKALEVLLAEPSSDLDPQAAAYHYTVGTLLIESGNPGRAVAHLEKARALAMRSEPLELALATARNRVEAGIGAGQLQRASLPMEKFADGPLFLPLEALTTILALMSAWSLWRRQRRQQPSRGWLAVAWWIVAASMLGLHAWVAQHPAARLLESSELRSGPGEDFLVVASAPAGAELRVLSSHPAQSEWVQVRLAPKLQGWVLSRNLLPLVTASTKPN